MCLTKGNTFVLYAGELVLRDEMFPIEAFQSLHNQWHFCSNEHHSLTCNACVRACLRAYEYKYMFQPHSISTIHELSSWVALHFSVQLFIIRFMLFGSMMDVICSRFMVWWFSDAFDTNIAITSTPMNYVKWFRSLHKMVSFSISFVKQK